MNDEPILYPAQWNSGRPDPTTETTLRRLLQLRLTKFEYGFVTGLLGHCPTPAQQNILAKLQTRYASVWKQKEGKYERSPRPQDGAECAAE